MRTVLMRRGSMLLLLALMGVGVMIAGCPSSEEMVPPPDTLEPLDETQTLGDPIKIGGIFATTGPASALGEPEANTAMMLQEQINAEGGIDGRPIEIVIRDTKGEETETLTVVKELIEKENVVALVGPSRSGTTMAIIEEVQAQEIPLVSCAAARAITEPVKEWVFSTPQSDEDAVVNIFDYLNDEGISSIAVITASDGFGQQGLIQLQALAPDAGLNIVRAEEFADTDKDMTVQLTNIKNSGADAVICWGIGPAPALIAKQAKQLNLGIPVIMSHGVANRRFIEGAGDGAEGVILPVGKLLVADQLPDDDPQKELLLQYAADYEAKFNKPADTFGGHAWDAIMLVVNAIKENGPEPAQIREGIENTEGFAGIGGVFNFSADRHYGLNPDAFVMVTIEDGDWKLMD
ncbi:MAG: ABC transporter substrate-binding protein [Armatimonadota bacterium]|jgi:branched-chain amino acid transport system substrate-binding protein